MKDLSPTMRRALQQMVAFPGYKGIHRPGVGGICKVRTAQALVDRGLATWVQHADAWKIVLTDAGKAIGAAEKGGAR